MHVRGQMDDSSEIGAALTARFLSDSATAEIATVAGGLTAVALFVGLRPLGELLLWFAILLVTVGIRYRVRRRAAARTPMPATMPAAVCLGILAVGLTWGIGAALLEHGAAEVPHLVMIFLCGLAAVATVTFVSSVLAFQLFAASLFIPLMSEILSDGGVTRDDLTNILVTVVYWAIMSALQRRGHAALVQSFRLQREVERSRAEAVEHAGVVRESEQRMVQLIESMPVGVIVLSTSGEIEFVNRAASNIAGPGMRAHATSEELSTVYPVYVPGTHDAYPVDKLPAVRALAGDSSIDQYEIAAPEGRRLIEAHGSPIRDQAGNVVYGVAVLTDLAERQRGDARRASLNAVLQLTADATSESALLDAVLPLLNERFGFVLSEMWAVDAGAGVMHRIGSSQRGNDPRLGVFDRASQPLVFRIGEGLPGGVWKSGEPMWWNPSGASDKIFVHGEGVEPIGLQTGVATPVFVAGVMSGALVSFATDRRVADGPTADTLMAIGAQIGGAIGRLRADAALRAAEERYRQLVEGSSDMVWELDLGGNTTFVNAASNRIFGVSPADLVGKPFLQTADPEHLAADMAVFGRVMQGAVIRAYETVHRNAAGESVVISTSAAPVRDAAGRITGFHGIARDVGDRAAARDALRAARDAAEEAAVAKSAFLANICHEIRPPMNGVLGVTELLLDTDLDAEQRRAVDLIATSGRSLMEIINEILDFSKIEANQLEIESAEFDLHELVESTMKIAAASINEGTVEIVTDIGRTVPVHTRGDATRLRQVLTNLISNAVKFTHAGEIVISVECVANDATGEQVCFTVRDTGIGMTDKTAAAIFEPFRQADSSTTRRYGGTGLGLSISRRLVGLMGGRLEVASEVGVGSRFGFTLAMPGLVHQPAPAESLLNGVPVLVVDDNTTNQRVMSGMLSGAGCAVDVAGSARAALEMIHRARNEGRPYRVLLSDVQMPNMDGFGLVRAIREDPTIAAMPVVLASSGSRRGDLAYANSLAIAAYLIKPLSRRELARAVQSALGVGAAAAPIRRPSIQRALRPLRILLAEDNAINQEVAKALLGRRGHLVDVVGDGRAAVAAALAEDYDVVLMDLQMPVLDGLDAAREIRAGRPGARPRIIALTANVLDGERERCLSGGMDGYLAKPFAAADLFAVVEDDRVYHDDLPAPVLKRVTKGAPIDLDTLLADLRDAGIEEMVPSLVLLFLRDGPDRVAAILAAMDAGDMDALGRAAHAMKSSAGALRATRLMSLLGAVEASAKTGSAATRASITGIVDEYDAVRRYLDSEAWKTS